MGLRATVMNILPVWPETALLAKCEDRAFQGAVAEKSAILTDVEYIRLRLPRQWDITSILSSQSASHFGVSWQHALGAVFIAGTLFILLSFVGLRATVMNILPVSLKNAIPAGIGLLIVLVSLEWAGIVVDYPATYVTLGDLTSASALLSLFGVAVITVLFALHVNATILIGILATTVVGLIVGIITFQGIVAASPSITPTLFKLQIPNIFADRRDLRVHLPRSVRYCWHVNRREPAGWVDG